MNNNIKDVIIIGSGPAGYTAGIYTSRAQLDTLMFAGDMFGGQLMFTTEVENFPGFENGIIGPKLMMEMRKQAERFGTQIINANITKVDFSNKILKVYQGEEMYQSKTVIVSTGAVALKLGLDNEDKYMGKGLSICAVCDAAFYGDKVVYVVGGGDSAIEDAVALTKFARKVYLVVRKDFLRASKIMQQRVMDNPKITILWNNEVKQLIGDKVLTHIKLINNKSNKEKEVELDGLFYAIGHSAGSDIFKDKLALNNKGFILTSINGLETKDKSLSEIWENGYPSMTSVPGVFSAGDVVDFRYRQAITAAGLGAMAGLDCEKYLTNN